jgi:hypothetical protein
MPLAPGNFALYFGMCNREVFANLDLNDSSKLATYTLQFIKECTILSCQVVKVTDSTTLILYTFNQCKSHRANWAYARF